MSAVVLFCDADYIIVFSEACLEAGGDEERRVCRDRVVKQVTRSIADRINHHIVTTKTRMASRL